MTSWHDHKCKTCGGAYQHEHHHTSPDHPQDDFQCPYQDCGNYFLKGKSVRPARNTRLLEGGELIIKAKNEDEGSAATTPKARADPAPGLTNWEKTIMIKFKDGSINCKDSRHFRRDYPMVNGAKSKYAVPVRHDLLHILSLMTPKKESACPCERDACREAWEWNEVGTLQTEYVVKGNYFKGIGTPSADRAVKPVCPVPFRLTESQFKQLSVKYPDWMFVQTGYQGHDHAVSHASTDIDTFNLKTKLRGNVLDLHGNPTANERSNKKKGAKCKVDTYVNLVTPKDHIRAKTKWGPQFDAAGRPRWHTGPYIRDAEVHMAALLADKDHIISVHSGYYYQNGEILSLLRGAKRDCKMSMLMHRFKGDKGSFNDGELTWERRGNDIVQTNARTGETYTQPCNERWFKSGSWTDVSRENACRKVEAPYIAPAYEYLLSDEQLRNNGELVDNEQYDAMRGLAWTINETSRDTFVVTVVGIPAHAHYNDPCTVPVVDNAVASIQETGCVVLDLGTPVSIPIRSEHAVLFDELRTGMVAVPRTEAKYKSHVNTVKAKAKSYFVENKVPSVPDSDSISNLIEASFWVDFRRDCATCSTLHVSAQWMVHQHDLALAGKSLATARNAAGVVLDVIGHALRAKSGRDTSAAVIESLRLLNSRAT